MAPYTRKEGNNYEPGEELKEKTESHQLLKKLYPEFHRFVIEYPKHRPKGLEESFFWVNNIVDDKPTMALAHHMILLKDDISVFCKRESISQLVQSIGAAFLFEDNDTVVLITQRTSTDHVAGFGGAAKRGIGAKVMGGKVANNFTQL